MLPEPPDHPTPPSEPAPIQAQDSPLDLSIERLDVQDALRLKGRPIGDLSDLELATAERGGLAAAPPEQAPIVKPGSWLKLRVQWPQRQVHVHLRVDEVVLDWFRRDGPKFQARINAVLRAYVDAQLEAERRGK